MANRMGFLGAKVLGTSSPITKDKLVMGKTEKTRSVYNKTTRRLIIMD
jgi:hypothetical protein